MRAVVRRDVAPENASVAAELERTLRSAGRQGDKSPFARRLTVAEFYEIIVDIARETLPPRAFAEFMIRLTERLSK
jgi:hypothetical protein